VALFALVALAERVACPWNRPVRTRPSRVLRHGRKEQTA
jgi:hypothetical protein